MYPAIIGNIGTTEIIIILVIALLLFGRRLPEVGRSLGKGIVEFKKGLKGVSDDLNDDIDDVDRKIDMISASKKEPVDIASKEKEKSS
jgi:sec-independent protein translocase protein TatA